MAKAERLPFIQLYPDDVLGDEALMMATDETVGVWFKMLMRMWKAPTRGILDGNIPQLARLLSTTENSIQRSIQEISYLGIGEVLHGSNGDVTVANRRMVRDEKSRESSRKRQEKHRAKKEDKEEVTPVSRPSHAPVTGHTSETIGHKSEEKHKTIESYTPSFLAAKEKYPKRSGGHNYPTAFASWEYWLKQGIAPDGQEVTEVSILRAIENYHAEQVAIGKVGTGFVCMFSTFLSKKSPRFPEYMSEDWTLDVQEPSSKHHKPAGADDPKWKEAQDAYPVD